MVHTFCRVLFWKDVEISGKTAVLLGGYGRIGEISRTDTAGLGSIGLYKAVNYLIERPSFRVEMASRHDVCIIITTNIANNYTVCNERAN